MAEQPKYQKVIEWVKAGMEDGTLKYGDRLLSEKELSEKFGLSRQTIRHATGELVNQHLVTRVQGSGTYIGSSYQAVRREQYHNIAVLSTFYESYIFPPTLRGIAKVLTKEGYSTQVSFTDNRIDSEETILLSLLEKDNIDGLIMEPSKSALPNPNLKYYQELMERHIPIICFNTTYPELKLPCVRLDDRKVAEKATQLLMRNGHKRIGGIFKADDGQGRIRYKGYTDALIAEGRHIHPRNILWIDTLMQQQIDHIGDYVMERLEGCTGVVCYNDDVAMNIINIAEAHGVRVPEDLSVVGIDDSNLATTCRVPFTSFPHPKDALGEKVARNMLELIRNPEFDANYLYDAEPVLRSSIRNLRAGII